MTTPPDPPPDPKPKTMTLNLSAAEMGALEEMAKVADVSKTGLIRQALRVYQYVSHRQRNGEEMAWIDKDGAVHRTIVFGCGGE